MDTLFIDPPWEIEDDTNLWKGIRSCFPSLGIAYIASYLEKHGKFSGILDCTAEGISVDKIDSRLDGFEKPDFIGITSTTPTIKNALSIAEICKRKFPGARVVLGGVHPSIMPDKVLECDWVDYVVRGEGEVTMKELLDGKDPENIPGLSFRKEDTVYHNPDRPLIEDLDEIPPPAYHLLPIKKYRPAVGSYKRLPVMNMFATRGCPGRCSFCYRTFHGRIRKRSAAKIIEEVKMLKHDYGIREVAFYDDSFTVFRDTVRQFCQLLKEERLNMKWSCFSLARHVDEELLKLMKKAGCHLILFGVESASEKVLKNLNKKISLEKTRNAIKTCRRIGINTRASFLIGSPGETEETIVKSIDFAIEADPDEVQFNIITAYPGTGLYDWGKENGYLTTDDWSCCNMSDINIVIPPMTEEILRKYYKLAHRKFYLRPKIIIRRLIKIRSLDQLKQEVRGLFAILSFLLKNKRNR